MLCSVALLLACRRRSGVTGSHVPVVSWMMSRISDQPPNPPRSNTDRLTAFLKSGTGLVTAVTAFAAAIAGLVAAVTQLGGGSAATPRTAPGGGPTTVVFQSAAQRELHSHVPRSIWPSCGPPVDPEEHAVAAFNCKYREIVGLQYNLFASSREMDHSYADVKRRYGLAGALTGRSCAAGRFEGDFRGVGRLLCFVDDDGHVAAIVWTDRRVDILSFAWRDDKDLPALYDAWRAGNAGPDA